MGGVARFEACFALVRKGDGWAGVWQLYHLLNLLCEVLHQLIFLGTLLFALGFNCLEVSFEYLKSFEQIDVQQRNRQCGCTLREDLWVTVGVYGPFVIENFKFTDFGDELTDLDLKSLLQGLNHSLDVLYLVVLYLEALD